MSTHRTTVGRPLPRAPRADRGLTELRISVTLGKQPMSAADQQERVPVPDGTRGRVWSEFHDAVRYSRYFNRKASDMASIHRVVLIAHAVLAAGVLTVLLGKPSIGFIAVGCSLGIAALSIWLLLSNYAEKLAAVHRICEYADEIAYQYRTLWDEMEIYTIDHEDVTSKLDEIEQIYLRADDLFRRVGFVIDETLNARSANQACDELRKAYAPVTVSQNSGTSTSS